MTASESRPYFGVEKSSNYDSTKEFHESNPVFCKDYNAKPYFTRQETPIHQAENSLNISMNNVNPEPILNKDGVHAVSVTDFVNKPNHNKSQSYLVQPTIKKRNSIYDRYNKNQPSKRQSLMYESHSQSNINNDTTNITLSRNFMKIRNRNTLTCITGDENTMNSQYQLAADREALARRMSLKDTALTKCFDDEHSQGFVAESNDSRKKNIKIENLKNNGNIMNIIENSKTKYKINNNQFQHKMIYESMKKLKPVKEILEKNSDLLKCFDDYYYKVQTTKITDDNIKASEAYHIERVMNNWLEETNENHFYIIANEKINRYEKIQKILKDYSKAIGGILHILKVGKYDYWVESLQYLWTCMVLLIEKYVDSVQVENDLKHSGEKKKWESERQEFFHKIENLEQQLRTNKDAFVEKEKQFKETQKELKHTLETERVD